VLAEAIRQQKNWAENGVDVQMAINLLPSNLRNDKLVDHIVTLCETEGVSPDRLILEVTESTVMGRALEALDTLTRLRLKGFHLAIDDFGTGFSSLTRLQRLPVTEIKIDRSFVIEALKMSDAFIIVKTIIDLAHNMRMTAVAEGVETPKHYQLLAELGCDLGQGNSIAKPLPPGEFQQWAVKWQDPRHVAGL
jgi:EAL domain-containing protein (putative c-di-GMP-specific phosphodiesterase class I)